MLTPQEVSTHSFTKAVMGGYNMAMVDEFLDELTDDYTALYKENAALKAKMKVLVEKVEDYRATEDSMRATLLTAQKMADSIVHEAEAKRDALLSRAEMDAREKIAQDMALANERVAQLSRELEELRSRPVEVAVQHAEEEELEQARREAAADARVRVEALENELAAARKQQSDLLNQHQEMDQKLKEARQARRDAMDAQKAAREELKQTREALERARKELRASGNKEITQFGVYFEACQEDFSRMMGILHKLKAGGDDEGRAKLTAAGGALLGAMEKQLAPFREEGAASC